MLDPQQSRSAHVRQRCDAGGEGCQTEANVMTWLAFAAEWQRDWPLTNTALALNDVVEQHTAGSGIAYLWEQLTPLSTTQPKFRIADGAFVRTEIVDIKVVARGNSPFAVSWQEKHVVSEPTAPRSRHDH
jgi:hypothetical protein